MSVRIMVVYVEIDDEVSQGDEFETLMSEVENVVKSYTSMDDAILKVKVVEP